MIIFWKESQCFTQVLCKRISRKASHAFSLYTVIRSLEKNVNVLPNCFAREFQEKHPMLFPYIRWSAQLFEIQEGWPGNRWSCCWSKKINTVNYIECVDNKRRRPQRGCAMITLLTIKISVLNSNSIGKLNIAILRRRGYVDRLSRCSRNASQAFLFTRWSAP